MFYTKLGFNKVMQSPFELEGESELCVLMKNREMLIELYQLSDKLLPGIRSRVNGSTGDMAAFLENRVRVF